MPFTALNSTQIVLYVVIIVFSPELTARPALIVLFLISDAKLIPFFELSQILDNKITKKSII